MKALRGASPYHVAEYIRSGYMYISVNVPILLICVFIVYFAVLLLGYWMGQNVRVFEITENYAVRNVPVQESCIGFRHPDSDEEAYAPEE